MKRTDSLLETAVVWLGLVTLPATLGLVLEPFLASALALALLLMALVATRSRGDDLPPARAIPAFVGGLAAGWLTAPLWALAITRLGACSGLAPVAPARFADLPLPAAGSALLLGPWVEELLYRERLLGALRRYGVAIAAGATSLLFALPHRRPWSMLTAFLLGLVLAGSMWVFRSTALCAGYHTGLNAFGVVRGLPDSHDAGAAFLGAVAAVGLLAFLLVELRRARRTFAGVAIAALVIPTTASAEALVFEAELRLEPTLAAIPSPSIEGVGVATLNGSSSSLALETLSLSGGLAGSAIVPVTDPQVSNGGMVALGLEASVGAGSLGPFQPAAPFSAMQLTRADLPVAGSLRFCVIFTGCGLGPTLRLLDTTTRGVVGVGVGGLVTAYPLSSVMLSLQGAPWTVRTATLPVTTSQGSSFVVSAAGLAHGPYSFTGSTALPGGEIQLVTPIRVSSSGAAPPTSDLFGRLTVRFLPEPRSLFVLGPAVLLLRLAARRRA